MVWNAIIGGGIGLAGTLLGGGSKGSEKAAERAAERETAATEAAVERTQEAFETSEMMLAPFAQQEQSAAAQLSAQMGLPTGGGGGMPAYGTGYGSARQQRVNLENFDNVVREMMTMAQVRFKRSGYKKDRVWREAAQTVGRKLEQMKRDGQLPADYQMPNTSELTALAEEIEDSYGGHTNMARNLYKNIKGGNREEANRIWNEAWDAAPTQLGERFGVTYQSDIPEGEMQPGGPGGMPGQGQMIAPAGPTPQTAADIMERAGLTQMPPELAEQYMEETMRMAESDPALAEYLGLTEESMMVGPEYQQLPAYQRMIEEGLEAVNVGAGAAGNLYSGRRGEALRDVGAETEMAFYQDAADRRAEMMRRRQLQREGEMGRMGVEYGAGLEREQSAYNNYMQMLTAMSSPTTATNIENLRSGAARGEGTMLMDTARSIGDLDIGAAGARQAARADMASGLMQLGEAFINR